MEPGKAGTMKQTDNTTPHNAAEYDVHIKMTIPYYDMMHRETIDLVQTVKPDVKTWLDTGCGTGALIDKACQHFQNTHFILCDPSQNMLDECKKRFKSIPDKKIAIMEPVSSQELDVRCRSGMDVITAIQAHLYLKRDERRKATENCYRLLDDKGLYVTFENIHPLFDEGIGIGLERWMKFQVSAGKHEREVEEHGKRFNKNYFPIRVQEHLDLLKEVGFRMYDLCWYSHMQAGFYAVK